MRKIIAVPYIIKDNTGVRDFVEEIKPYPVRETIYDSKYDWVDVEANGSNFTELKKDIFEKCAQLSKEFPRRFVIGGDHSITYPFLIEDDVKQLVVFDHHSDGVHPRIGLENTELNCGTWAYWLTKHRPDIRYIGLFYPCGNQVDFHIREAGMTRKMALLLNPMPRYIEKYHIKEELKSALKDKKTAFSICADCCDVFKSRFETTSDLVDLDELIETIKVVNDRTDLAHIDLMEANLIDADSIKAVKKVTETAMQLKSLNCCS
jgi:arginase family enzyme